MRLHHGSERQADHANNDRQPGDRPSRRNPVPSSLLSDLLLLYLDVVLLRCIVACQSTMETCFARSHEMRAMTTILERRGKIESLVHVHAPLNVL
jgi:hypothetical protein